MSDNRKAAAKNVRLSAFCALRFIWFSYNWKAATKIERHLFLLIADNRKAAANNTKKLDKISILSDNRKAAADNAGNV